MGNEGEGGEIRVPEQAEELGHAGVAQRSVAHILGAEMKGGQVRQGRRRGGRERTDLDGEERAGDEPAVHGAEQAAAEAVQCELEPYRG